MASQRSPTEAEKSAEARLGGIALRREQMAVVANIYRAAAGERHGVEGGEPVGDLVPRHLRHGQPHLRLGNLLAPTEIRIMFEELIPRLSSIRHAGDVPRVRSDLVHGIKKLPVEVILA